MKKYEAQMNLPFDIKKGEILTEVKGKLMKENGTIVPYNPIKEATFFKEVKELELSFPKDSLVALRVPVKNPNLHSDRSFKSSYITIPAWTPLKVVSAVERYKKLYAVVDFNGYKYEIKEEDLIAYVPYYFINSSGEVHSAIGDRDVKADVYRVKAKNYFKTKADAQDALNKILAKPIIKKVKESVKV